MTPDVVAAAIGRLTNEVVALRGEVREVRDDVLPRLAVLEAAFTKRGQRWSLLTAYTLAVLGGAAAIIQPLIGG